MRKQRTFESEHQRERVNLKHSRNNAGRNAGKTFVVPTTCKIDGCGKPRYRPTTNMCKAHHMAYLKKMKGAAGPGWEDLILSPSRAMNAVEALPSSKGFKVKCVTLPGLRGPDGSMTAELGFDAMAAVRGMKPLPGK